MESLNFKKTILSLKRSLLLYYVFFDNHNVEFLKLFCEVLERTIDNLDFLCYNV